MTFIDHLKKKINEVAVAGKNDIAAHDEKAESDTAADPHVAGSRASDDGTDGDYVGRTTPDIDSDVEESGAEARSEQARRSP